MFRLLGKLVSRGWPFMLFLWATLAVLLAIYAPPLDEITTDGPGFTLPEGYDSRAADDLLIEAGVEERSRLLLLVGSDKPLTPEDHKLIRETLDDYVGNRETFPIVGLVLSPYTPLPGLRKRLTSEDHTTVMCSVGLKSQFVDGTTYSYVNKVGAHLDAFVASHPHLSYEMTDSAVIGRDYDKEAGTSLNRTRVTTILLVVSILLLLYRSPVTWIVPLATIGLSLFIATNVMALLGQSGLMEVPALVPIYMIVILFGSGTDYCLFLIGRFREEMARGHSRFEAARVAVTQVGEAITASAGTTIAGLCTMGFADFAIFRTTGPALGIGLAVALLAALTFAPALMVVLGKRLFWPLIPRLIDVEKTHQGHVWARFAQLVIKRPGLVLMLTILCFVPLAGIGGTTTPSYDLFSELPADAPSVRGNRLINEKFAETSRAEQLVLVVKSGMDFKTHRGLRAVDEISKALCAWDEVIEVRSITRPLGKSEPSVEAYIGAQRPGVRETFSAMTTLALAFPRYVYRSKDQESSITRIHILLKYETFSGEAIGMAARLRPAVATALATAGVDDAEFHFGGISAHMSDLGAITRKDLARLRWMMLGVLYVILTIMLRGGIAPIYLLATMVLNYFAALGITHLVFAGLQGVAFADILHVQVLDWKVGFFLFVLLVAIGVDYNIYIMSRLREEMKRRPFRDALRHAIVFTGSIISSCGIIMAGTFGSMMRSTLTMMVQIGMAMAVGVLLDTFLIRPFVVPALALQVERIKEKIRGERKPG